MSSYIQVLEKLADGQFHSGEALAKSLGVSRAAIWKSLQKIKNIGLDVYAVRGRGYCLQDKLDLLDVDSIMNALHEETRAQIPNLHCYQQIDSTNRQLQKDNCLSGSVCLAESQSQGRGRRGRQWVSPFASSIYLSITWTYPQGPAVLSALSLALGIAVIRGLAAYAQDDLGLKWPNDIYWQDKKLGGVLVEVSGEANGPCTVVVGIGVNVRMPAQMGTQIDQPWTDLYRINPDGLASRNIIAAGLIDEVVKVLKDYPHKGFVSYQQEWMQWDIVKDRSVCLSSPAQEIAGVVRGVDDAGSLLLETANGIEVIQSGEISLRVKQ